MPWFCERWQRAGGASSLPDSLSSPLRRQSAGGLAEAANAPGSRAPPLSRPATLLEFLAASTGTGIVSSRFGRRQSHRFALPGIAIQLAKHAVSFGKKSVDVRLLLAKRCDQFSSSRLLVTRIWKYLDIAAVVVITHRNTGGFRRVSQRLGSGFIACRKG